MNCNARLSRLALWRPDEGLPSLWRRGSDLAALERDGSPLATIEALATCSGEQLPAWLPDRIAAVMQNPKVSQMLRRQRRLLVAFVRFRSSVACDGHHTLAAAALTRAGLTCTARQVKEDFHRFAAKLDSIEAATEPVLPDFIPSPATLRLLTWSDLAGVIALRPGARIVLQNGSQLSGKCSVVMSA